MTESENEKITECYKQMYQGMIQKDRTILDAVLHNSFVLVHMTGMRQSKEAYIRAVENGTLNYYEALHENITVSDDDKGARLTGQSLVIAAVFGGGRNTWRLQLEISLKKENERWLMTKAVASTY